MSSPKIDQCPPGTGINGCGDCTYTAVVLPTTPPAGDNRYNLTSCRPCPAGSFNNGSSLYCLGCRTRCPRSTGIIIDSDILPCNPVEDFICYTCPDGRFNDGTFLQCRGCSGSCDAGTGADFALGGDTCQRGRNRVCKRSCDLLPEGNLTAAKSVIPIPDASNLGPLQIKESYYWNDGSKLFCQECSTCPAGRGSNGINGTFCTNVRDRVCGACLDGKTYNDGTFTQCQPCSKGGCNYPGQGELSKCVTNADRVCGNCEAGSWNDGKVPYCLHCATYCPAGYGLEQPCKNDRDVLCTPCKPGTWNDGYLLFCQPWAKYCERGYGIDWYLKGHEGDETSDVVCKPYCSDLGLFWNNGKYLYCQPCDLCPAGTGENGEYGIYCDAYRNRVCGRCQENTFNDGLTIDCRSCDKGPCPLGQGAQFGTPCGPFADRACGSCPSQWWNDGTYADCQRCKTKCDVPDAIQLQACTAWNDLICLNPWDDGYMDMKMAMVAGMEKDGTPLPPAVAISLGGVGVFMLLVGGGIMYNRQKKREMAVLEGNPAPAIPREATRASIQEELSSPLVNTPARRRLINEGERTEATVN